MTTFISSSLSLTILLNSSDITARCWQLIRIVPKASHPVVTNSARSGRIGLVEQSAMSFRHRSYLCNFVSHQVLAPDRPTTRFSPILIQASWLRYGLFVRASFKMLVGEKRGGAVACEQCARSRIDFIRLYLRYRMMAMDNVVARFERNIAVRRSAVE